jgi:hypothetical protein
MRQLSRSWSLVAVVAIWLLVVPPATAAPPPNDARGAAQPLALPASVSGTTVEATVEMDEPPSGCAASGGSVWYAFASPGDRPVIVDLEAAGDLDAVVDVFQRERSQLLGVACRQTNRRGVATLELDAEAGANYLVRVAALPNSERDRFRLRVLAPNPPATFPGRRLPRRGTSGAVDRLTNPDDAWAVRLREGRAYRVNFVSRGGHCANLELYAPGQELAGSARCDRHLVYVPPRSGVHTLFVRAPRGERSSIAYRLRAGAARADDTAPGRRLANDVGVRGRLQGSELDALDLYRFSLGRASLLRVSLRTTGGDLAVTLLRESGRRLGTGDQIERRVRPGRYFVAVRARDGANGRYTLRRLARAITHARALVDGKRSTTVAPGHTVTLGLDVDPDVSGGRATLLVERFDPLAGWLFFARQRPAVRNGRAAVAFRPPSVGRWRVRGTYGGTRLAAPSDGGTARLSVQEPLAG